MNRTILNFEAVVHSSGTDEDGRNVFTVQLMMNHRPVMSWTLDLEHGYPLTQDRAHLDAFVAGKLFEVMHR